MNCNALAQASVKLLQSQEAGALSCVEKSLHFERISACRVPGALYSAGLEIRQACPDVFLDSWAQGILHFLIDHRILTGLSLACVCLTTLYAVQALQTQARFRRALHVAGVNALLCGLILIWDWGVLARTIRARVLRPTQLFLLPSTDNPIPLRELGTSSSVTIRGKLDQNLIQVETPDGTQGYVPREDLLWMRE